MKPLSAVVVAVIAAGQAAWNALPFGDSPAAPETSAVTAETIPPAAPIPAAPAPKAAPTSASADLDSLAGGDAILPGTRRDAKVVGKAYGLRVEWNEVSFCDGRGGRAIDLATGEERRLDRDCTPDDAPNDACDIGEIDVTVEEHSAADRLQLNGATYPVSGRVRDCDADGDGLAVVTDKALVVVDAHGDVTTVDLASGGKRLAFGPKWIAWSDATSVHAVHR